MRQPYDAITSIRKDRNLLESIVILQLEILLVAQKSPGFEQWFYPYDIIAYLRPSTRIYRKLCLNKKCKSYLVVSLVMTLNYDKEQMIV